MKANPYPAACLNRRGMAALAAVSLFFIAGVQPSALAQPTSTFTYSGRLMQSNAPADGLFNITFTLHSAPTANTPVGNPNTVFRSPVSITNGLFTIPLDFGPDAFSGETRWLELTIGPAGAPPANNTLLSPRQLLSMVPQTTYARKAGAAVTADTATFATRSQGAAVADLATNATLAATATRSVRSDTADTATFATRSQGAAVADLADLATFATRSQGAAVADSAVVATKSLSLEPGTHTNSVNFVNSGNSFSGSGADLTSLNAGQLTSGVVSDARLNSNIARLTANQAFTGNNHFHNRITTGLDFGIPGAITFRPPDGFAYFHIDNGPAGGRTNGKMRFSYGGSPGDFPVMTLMQDLRVGIGPTSPLHRLHVGEPSGAATINSASQRCVVEDGLTSGRAAFLAVAGPAPAVGSQRVEVQMEASQSGLGFMGTASNHPLAFVTANQSRLAISSAGNLTVNGSGTLSFGAAIGQLVNLVGSLYAVGVQSDTLYFRTGNHFSWHRIGIHSDTAHDPGAGGLELMRLTSPGNLNVRGNVVANSVILSSDRNAKKDFRSVEPQSVLDKLAALPVSEWSYKSDPSVRHLGPMAQDFHAAFGVGPDDRHIATVDADGVALAAIQGLNGKFEDEMERKDDEIASLKQAITDLRRSVEALARKSEGGAK